MNYRRAATAAAAGAIALGFAACTGGSKPADTMPITTPTTTGTSASTTGSTPTSSTTAPSSTSSAPSTTSTPGVPPPVANIPPAARPNTKAGAQEFVKYFIAQVNRAYTTADPSLMNGLWDNGCSWCRSIHDTISGYQASGQKYDGTPFVLEVAQVIEQQQGFTVVLAVGHTPKGLVVDSHGSTVKETTPRRLNIDFTLWRKPDWQVTKVIANTPR